MVITFKQWIKKSSIKSVPVNGSNLKFPIMMFKKKWSAEMRTSNTNARMSGAKNFLSSFLNPIKAKTDARTPKQENPE